jgi:two-component system, NarL family, nitrate/nitrite response regulator NarL
MAMRPSTVQAGTLSVLIADPDGLARRMMRDALRETDGVGSVHTAGSARESLELARYYRPTVAIVDTSLAFVDTSLASNGAIDVIGRVLALVPETRIVTVSVDAPHTAIAALRAGAVGHIHKDIDPERFARLVLRAADGEAIIPQELLMPLLELLRAIPDRGWRPLNSRLTTREWEIIELLGAGATTQTIAERLTVSSTTVYSHVKSVLRKLGVNSRRDAVIAAEHLRREEVSSTVRPRPVRSSYYV